MPSLPRDRKGDGVGTLTQPDIGALLEQAGCQPRGNHRHDCAQCGGKRTVTHSEEAFYCHRCQWKGNVITLAKELGVYQRIPSPEYKEFCRKRERARDAAQRLYAAAKRRRFELLEELHSLNRIEAGAHHAGPSDTAWNGLALVYSERPTIETELDRLEGGSAGELVKLLVECPL